MPTQYPRCQAYYGGQLQAAPADGSTFDTIDPATGQVLATVETSTEGMIDAAFAAAQTAFEGWAATPAVERARILQRAAQLLRERNDEFAARETHDTGKPISETAAVDVATGADVLEFFANLVGGGGLAGERVQLRADAWAESTKEPLGVCVGIGAWNYPVQIALWKSAPCLAAGNAMVYKPSEVTPLHAQALAALYAEAGLPPGVFSVVHGDGRVGAYLSKHPAAAKVSFTGQPSTGRKVAAAAAGEMKYVTMELGGKSPLIVLPDCDLDLAADGAMMANFYSSGQVCTNGTRVFVPSAMRPAFEQKILERLAHVRPGHPDDPATNFGPLVSKAHREKVLSYIRHGVDKDRARVLAGGPETPDNLPSGCEAGYWVRPTVFSPATDDMLVVREEIFGPVMCVLPYDTVDEAVRRANATPLGLAAGVFGKDLATCHGVLQRLQAGILWLNTWGESPAEMSVGGWKSSGLGVENGRRGIEAWVRNRSTLVDLSGKVASVFAKL